MVTGALNTQRSTADLDATTPLETTLPTEQIGQFSDAVNKFVEHTNKTQNNVHFKPVSINSQTFDGKNEKFELYEDWFHTYISMQPAMDEQMKINHFHALMRKDALLTFTHIPKESRKTLESILIIFRQKYVKPQEQRLQSTNGRIYCSILQNNHLQIFYKN